MRIILNIYCIVVFLIAQPVEASSYIGKGEYNEIKMENFKFLVSLEVKKHEEEMAILLGEIRNQLIYINGSMPSRALSSLRESPIWIEWEDTKFPGAVYHPSKKWLLANGYNPEKAGCIQISNVMNFIYSSKEGAAIALVHELSHALTNRSEYFAEISEAYFGKNDYFPFNKNELIKHDPSGYELMRRFW